MWRNIIYSYLKHIIQVLLKKRACIYPGGAGVKMAPYWFCKTKKAPYKCNIHSFTYIWCFSAYRVSSSQSGTEWDSNWFGGNHGNGMYRCWDSTSRDQVVQRWGSLLENLTPSLLPRDRKVKINWILGASLWARWPSAEINLICKNRASPRDFGDRGNPGYGCWRLYLRCHKWSRNSCGQSHPWCGL